MTDWRGVQWEWVAAVVCRLLASCLSMLSSSWTVNWWLLYVWSVCDRYLLFYHKQILEYEWRPPSHNTLHSTHSLSPTTATATATAGCHDVMMLWCCGVTACQGAVCDGNESWMECVVTSVIIVHWLIDWIETNRKQYRKYWSWLEAVSSGGWWEMIQCRQCLVLSVCMYVWSSVCLSVCVWLCGFVVRC